MGNLLALTALVLFAGNVLLVRAAAPRLGQQVGFLIALVGNVVFGAVLVLGQRLVTGRPWDLHWGALGIFALAGIFASYLGRRWFFRSVETIGPSRASALQITNPMFALLLGWLFLSEHVGPLDLALMALVLVGLYFTSRVPSREQPEAEGGDGGVLVSAPGAARVAAAAQPTRRRPRVGGAGLPRRELGLALFSAATYAVGNVLRSAGVHRWDEPVIGGFLGAVTGTLAYLVLHTSVRRLWSDVRAADVVGVRLWTLSGVLTVTAQICVIASTSYIPVALAVVISSALPVIVVPVSVFLLGNRERITGQTVAGTGLVLVGVAALLLH